MRRVVALSLVGVFACLAAVPVGAQEAPPQVADTLRAYSITPPGQDGTITAGEFASGDYGPHFDDQREMYAALIEDDDVTEEELLNYFHSMQFGPGEEITDEYSPTEGVTVYRDNFGVPHIYGDSFQTASFGMGYVTAEDRLFQMDVFRHAARGTLAAFVGPGTDNAFVERDKATRRDGYTEEEVQAIFDSFDERFGEVGVAIQEGLQGYTDGVNAYMDEIRMDPTRRPVEYDAQGRTAPEYPEEWSNLDTLFIAVLQLRVFGETAGTELQNAGFLSHLQEKHGRKKGLAIYDELLFQNDPRAAVSVAKSDADFKTQPLGEINWKAVAIPDKAEAMARRLAREERAHADFLESLGFKKQASNALLVSADKSATGNPLLLGAPQVGHALPSFFMDLDVHAPGIDFRGPAVPGASALIPLGRGADYAWSLTTGYSDAVDVRAEKLCDPAGGEATKDSNGYMFKGECREMESRTETIEINPPATDPGPPSSEDVTIYRTVHGPVFDRGSVDGKPVAFVKERFFWMKELDSLPSFYRWNTGIDSLEDFAAAAKDFTMSFNSFYADSENIAYFHVGEYPIRAKGVHPSLPTWGTGRWEWKGRRSYATQPKIVNPDQGWVANWNNKPAQSWDNMDGFKWGPLHRVQLLIDQMHALLDDGRATLSDLADVIRVAATQDARGVYLAPQMLRKASKAPEAPENYLQAVEIVRTWVEGGAHRRNADRDDTMDEGAALAIYDTWYDILAHRVFDDEIGEDGYALMADAPIVNYQPSGGGGFWFDFSSYLRNIFTRRTRLARFDRNYCNDIGTPEKETCLRVIQDALTAALAKLTEEQGEDMSAWTTPAENLSFTDNANSATAGSVDDIPWQNRGTENHLVEVLSDAD
jgi:acyl-homoserine lactone acylase PvdQ